MSQQPNKILLVDDEEKLLSALRRRLSNEFEIVTATGGIQALTIINEDPGIAVVVADMQMPEMNGIELLKQVKVQAPEIRRLMLTGNADLETAIAAINEGKVMRFLRKPCDSADLKSALSHALAEYVFQTDNSNPATDLDLASDKGEQAKQAFLSVMNHELRTPLNQILGFASALEANPPNANDPNSISLLGQIQSSGEHMLALVNRILEFSRLSALTEKNDRKSKADLISIVKDEVEEQRKQGNQKGVTISFDSLRRTAEVNATAADVRVAVRELLTNAIKFNTSDGHVSVLIKCEKDHAALRITDTGCGIPTDAIEFVKKPFRQVDETYSRPFEGLGLGLALVSTVAEVNNAKFSIRSHGSEGTETTLVFQRANTNTQKMASAS